MSGDKDSKIRTNTSAQDRVEIDSLTLEALKKGPIDIFNDI